MHKMCAVPKNYVFNNPRLNKIITSLITRSSIGVISKMCIKYIFNHYHYHYLYYFYNYYKMASRLLNTKSNQGMIYAFLGFHSCRKFVDSFQNCLRTGTAGARNPVDCYTEAKVLHECYDQTSTKIQPIAIPIFNDVRECLFQNDSHIFNCKEELNELYQAQHNPKQYVKMLKYSTPHQRQPKIYNTVLNNGSDDLN